MDSEKSVKQQENAFYQNKINSIIKVFNKHNISAYYAEDENSAVDIVLDTITSFSSINQSDSNSVNVGVADSLTLHQIDLFERLETLKSKGTITLCNPFERLEDGRYSEFKDLPRGWIEASSYDEAMMKVMNKMRKALLSDVFVTGANAIRWMEKLYQQMVWVID